MTDKIHPQILILSGPSGAGKTTLSNALIASFPDIVISISHTTRQPRPGENNGEDYFFIDKDAFMQLEKEGKMLEFAEVYNNYYGTSRDTIDQALAQNKTIILDIDWQGAKKIKSFYPEATSVFILPPARKNIEERLLSRQQDSEQTIQKRMSAYESQIAHQDEFDHVVTNIDIDDATRQLSDILKTRAAQ